MSVNPRSHYFLPSGQTNIMIIEDGDGIEMDNNLSPNALYEQYIHGNVQAVSFSDLDIRYNKFIFGTNVHINEILNKEIIILNVKFAKSRFENKRDSYNSNNYKFTYAKIQLIIPSESNAPRILNSSGRYIMEACDKMIQKNCFPIKCTIVKNEAGRYYYFK